MTALLLLFVMATHTGARRLAAAAAESPLLLRPLAWTWPRHLEKRVDRFEGLHDACAVLGPGQTPDTAALRRDTPGLYVIAAAKARPADVVFLPGDLRATLRVKCGGVWTRRQPPTLFYEHHFLQRRALWVHRGPGFHEVFEDNTWVEVAHCAYGNLTSMPPFFFAAGGSGVWLNVGRSLRLDFNEERGPAVHRAVADGDFGGAARLLDVDFTTYASVHFRNMRGGTWPADVLTEMAFLRLDGSEADVIGKFLPVLRCGPRSALRPCQKSDAALRQQTDCRLSLHDHLLDPVRDTHGHLKLTDVVASRGVREVLERPSCALENCSVIAERARFYNAQIVELEASLPDAEAAVERSQQAVTEKVAARDRAAQKNKEDASGKNAAKNAANLKNAEASLSVKREKAQTATEHVAYVLAKAASARQRARLAEAHGASHASVGLLLALMRHSWLRRDGACRRSRRRRRRSTPGAGASCSSDS